MTSAYQSVKYLSWIMFSLIYFKSFIDHLTNIFSWILDQAYQSWKFELINGHNNFNLNWIERLISWMLKIMMFEIMQSDNFINVIENKICTQIMGQYNWVTKDCEMVMKIQSWFSANYLVIKLALICMNSSEISTRKWL